MKIMKYPRDDTWIEYLEVNMKRKTEHGRKKSEAEEKLHCKINLIRMKHKKVKKTEEGLRRREILGDVRTKTWLIQIQIQIHMVY